jgi:hypothetical protein
MNIFPENKIFVFGFVIEEKWFLWQKKEIDVETERTAKWINAQFLSISTGRDFQPRQFMMNLCTSSNLI